MDHIQLHNNIIFIIRFIKKNPSVTDFGVFKPVRLLKSEWISWTPKTSVECRLWKFFPLLICSLGLVTKPERAGRGDGNVTRT